MERSAFFCKRTKRSRVLLGSLQKSVAFFAFFYVLCKRRLRSLQKNVAFFAFFSVLWNRKVSSFGSHKSPKIRKKNGKERNVLLKERNIPNGKERGAQP